MLIITKNLLIFIGNPSIHDKKLRVIDQLANQKPVRLVVIASKQLPLVEAKPY